MPATLGRPVLVHLGVLHKNQGIREAVENVERTCTTAPEGAHLSYHDRVTYASLALTHPPSGKEGFLKIAPFLCRNRFGNA